ncbi:MAG: hypothetical protein RLZZ66_2265 [Pseudomonadota bacterium]|jgi:uncharacterized lipoprotein
MIKKQNAVVVFALSFLVLACSSRSSRYHDTAMLERPPTLALQKNTQNSNIIIDDSIEPKKKRPGLNSTVTLLGDDVNKRVLIKQPITQAWRTLGMALKQSEIKITDYEKGKYNYYVNYHSEGVLTNVINFLNEEESKTIYLLTLSSQGDDSLIQAELASRNEQNSQNNDGVLMKPNDDSEGLIEAIYFLLHDDIKTE